MTVSEELTTPDQLAYINISDGCSWDMLVRSSINYIKQLEMLVL